MRFRIARPADVPAILDQMRDLYEQDGLRYRRAVARRALTGLMQARHFGRVYVLEDRGAVVGYAVLALSWSLAYQGSDAFIDELYVAPSHRGRGLGRKLVDFIVAQCRSFGVKALHLEVERPNHRARALYRTSRFVDHRQVMMTRMLARG